MFSRATLLGLALGALVVLGGATSARANDWDRECRSSMNREQKDLRRAVHRFGYFSWQAQQERAELSRLSARCNDRSWERGNRFRRYGDRDRDNRRRDRGRDRYRRDRDHDGDRD